MSHANSLIAANATAPAVEHRSCAPVLVIGHGSSGTSIFCRLLLDHLQIAFGTESQFIVRFYDRIHRYGNLRKDANLRLLIRHLMRERWFYRSRKFGYTPNSDAIFEAVNERTYRGVLDAVFGEYAQQLGMTRWGDKSPDYVNRLEVIGELFPDAKYIHLIRDGRDVAHSVMHRYWGEKNIQTAAAVWSRHVRLLDEFIETLPASQVIEIRYKDLLRSPVETMLSVATFLEIEDSEERLAKQLRQCLPEELKHDNFDKWKRSWTGEQRDAFERIACLELRRHGYETIRETTRPEIGSFRRIVHWGDNRLRKYVWPKYWADNWYKARLRTRDVLQAVDCRLQRS